MSESGRDDIIVARANTIGHCVVLNYAKLSFAQRKEALLVGYLDPFLPARAASCDDVLVAGSDKVTLGQTRYCSYVGGNLGTSAEK